MCQIDERNPSALRSHVSMLSLPHADSLSGWIPRRSAMREHALFTIRNLLKNNQENQDFVCVLSLAVCARTTSLELIKHHGVRSEALKPQYRIGQNGELMDLPPALRKS